MVQIAIPRQMFQEILQLIAELQLQPQRQHETTNGVRSTATVGRRAPECQRTRPDQTVKRHSDAWNGDSLAAPGSWASPRPRPSSRARSCFARPGKAVGALFARPAPQGPSAPRARGSSRDGCFTCLGSVLTDEGALSLQCALMRQLLGAATDIVGLSAGSGEFPNQRK
jgi:hypothetical protein